MSRTCQNKVTIAGGISKIPISSKYFLRFCISKENAENKFEFCFRRFTNIFINLSHATPDSCCEIMIDIRKISVN